MSSQLGVTSSCVGQPLTVLICHYYRVGGVVCMSNFPYGVCGDLDQFVACLIATSYIPLSSVMVVIS